MGRYEENHWCNLAPSNPRYSAQSVVISIYVDVNIAVTLE
jgi:hypothetical protein